MTSEKRDRAALRAAERLDALYEFDREPVREDRLCGWGYFAASFAGEHVAATEFVIGALFVNWGAGLKDVLLGLAVGNLLAVLSWGLVCAPLAVETRLTLYWYLRRMGGPHVSLCYNVLNALLFCVLAGCMITVSASAVRIPFGIPEQTRWFPTHPGFVAVVILVGAVVTVLAVAGFRRLAAFAAVCAPWMLLMFLAGFLVMLPRLAAAVGVGEIRSVADFLEVGRKAVWTGHTPGGGPPAIGFWHVAAFAWICNLAMHLGLSDMALFRFARRSAYGYLSACGMFLGHYLAWIFAGVMGAGAALALGRPLPELDSGAVAFQALGLAGAVAVVVAGWTTSNPTLYRAGLALQAVTPNWPRWKVTVAAGAVTTLVACFPFVFTGLLHFVGIYGLVLAPVGALAVAEQWILPRMGPGRRRAVRGENETNLPALLAWAAGGALALVLGLSGALHLFFLFVPEYLCTLVLYVLLVRWDARRNPAPGPASTEEAPDLPSPERAGAPSTASAGRTPGRGRLLLGGLALLCLLACVAPAFLVAAGSMEGYGERLAVYQRWLPPATLLYFVFGTAWYLKRVRPGGPAT